MQRRKLARAIPISFIVLFAVVLALVAIPVASAATPIYVRPGGDDALCNGTVDVDYSAGVAPNCAVKTIEQGIALVDPGGTVSVGAGTYTIPVSTEVALNNANLTLLGAGSASTHVQVSGNGYTFKITAPGVTIQGLDIVKTDKTDQHQIIYIGASNVTIIDNLIRGQYVFGDPEVSRAMVTTGGLSGLLIQGNTIHSLRQPAYVSGPTTGLVNNNTVYGTRGWVLEQGDLTFTNNNWGSGNIFDIAILSGVSSVYYTDIVGMSNANNEAVIEDQRSVPFVLSVAYVDDSAAPGGNGGQIQPYQTIAPAIPRVVAGGTIKVLPGAYTENVNVNKALKLRGAAGGGFSTAVATGPTAAPGVWYVDRYAPAVFESYTFMGEKVLRHGVRIADSAANRPPAYSSPFYNTQGRKLDTNLAGSQQSMSIDLWLDPTMAGPDGRIAGLWATGVDSSDVVSSYPILAFRNRDQISGFPPVTPGFYGWDFNGSGGYILLKATTAADYNKWHTLSFVWTVGTGAQYFLDGEPMLAIAETDTTKLANVILNVYNFGQDYDVYWDNYKVGSATPATFESVVTGQITISSNDVEVTGLYLTNPGQAYSVLASGALNNIKIANNRIQDLGGVSTTAQIKGVYAPNGADNVTISNNVFNKIVASSTRSADAINFGDSTTTDQNTGVVIEANTISNITAGRGAYGVKLNNGAGVPGVQVKNNTFTGLNGLWSHAVGLETNTSSAVVTGNTFSNLTVTSGTDNAAVWFESNPSSNTATVTGNKFNGTAFHGVLINAADVGLGRTATAENNWWGTSCGPGPVGPGTGALVGTNVDFFPWWTDVYGGSSSSYSGSAWIVPAGSTTAQTNAILACAGSGSTVQFATSASPYQGGLLVNNPGVTISLNGQTVGPGSPAFTINAPDVTLNGPGTLDGGGTLVDPGIVVTPAGDNFILDGVEIKGWKDGVQVAGLVDGDIESLKIVNNWIHNNAESGLQVDKAVGGVVTIQGNLFKANTGNGVDFGGAGSLDATYNSWGADQGPTATGGDGVGSTVLYDPWTFAEVYLDVDPTTAGDQLTRNVSESTTTTSFGVNLNVDGENLYGVSFVFSYDTVLLTPGAVSFDPQWTGLCVSLTGLPANAIGYRCNRTSGPAWDGGTVATFNFTVNSGALTGNGPWTAVFDISALPTDTSAGSQGGVKVFVNNAGYGAASIMPDRDITDANDGQVTIVGIAKFRGFVDLQGRPNDSGAVVDVYNQLATSGATLLASGASASSGSYTTNYVGANVLSVGTTYYFQVDRALYLPTTVKNPALAPNWAQSKSLATRPLTSLATLLLLGGDATDDNLIDINDATCIGPAYGGGPVVCNVTGNSDVNGDGATNILDLVLFGGNYLLSASPWTP